MTFSERIIERAVRRPPDFIIGRLDDPYLLRWWLTPWSRMYRNVEKPNLWHRFVSCLPGIYLHCFMRSDDDRALHDHPWTNLSILLRGTYREHTIDAGGINRRRQFYVGECKFRWRGGMAHRLELTDGMCWTLFLTGFRYREWGFHCPERGWVHWKEFTAAGRPGEIGKGCDG